MDKYPALRTVSGLLKIAGWVVLVIGTILFLVGLTELVGRSSDGSSMMSGASGVLNIGVGVGCAVMGLSTVALGEFANVLMDIEVNTRTAVRPFPDAAAPTASTAEPVTAVPVAERKLDAAIAVHLESLSEAELRGIIMEKNYDTGGLSTRWSRKELITFIKARS